jgi:uncharacterized protein (DUF1800 family)
MAVPSASTRHMINRFSYGYTPSLHKAITKAGGPQEWFAAQLKPSKVSDKKADAMKAWYPYLRSSSRKRQQADRTKKRSSYEQSMDLVRWTILRRIFSKRQVHEVMVDFWSNLLHVPAYGDGWMYRASYDATIRKYALGKFSDLLLRATVHPAMLVFLNSAGSTKNALNENHGRELLELHTVGVKAGYTEHMVVDSARVLTGYHVETWQPAKKTYVTADHYTGPLHILGWKAANANGEGRTELRSYLHYLAAHPATAQRLATRLCQRFVADKPSDEIVAAVAKAYTDSGTSIKAALRALVKHPDFVASAEGLVRSPGQDAIATYRAMRVKVSKPKQSGDFGSAVNYVLDEMGQAPFMWPAPNGFPEPSVAWASAGRMRSSWGMHHTTAGGWWPSKGMSRKQPRNYLPKGPVRFDDAVDSVSRSLLGRRASADLVKAAALLIDYEPTATIKSREDFGDWRAVPLIATVLNSPQHLRK